MDRAGQGAGDLQDGVALGLDLAEGLGQAEPLARIVQVQRIEDFQPVEPRAHRRVEIVPDLDAVGKAGKPAFGSDRFGAQHAGAVELVVVAVIEMPGLPGHQLLALDLDDMRIGAGADGDDAGQGFLVQPLDGLDRMLLERAEHVGDQRPASPRSARRRRTRSCRVPRKRGRSAPVPPRRPVPRGSRR